MNIVGAWKRGYTGKDVVVTILDDGIERNHPDLIQNYVSVYCMFVGACTASVQNIRSACSFPDIDQVIPGDSYDPLLISTVKYKSV